MNTRFVAAVAACAVVLGAGAANAADLPVRMTTKAPIYTKAPPPIELFNWTGFYVGANVGFASAHVDSLLTTVDTSQTATGVIGGGQVGYNWDGEPELGCRLGHRFPGFRDEGLGDQHGHAAGRLCYLKSVE